MKFLIHTLTTVFVGLAISGCTVQEVQKFTYNTGANTGCRHANDNLPNEKQLDDECRQNQGDGMSYEEYMELRNEVDGKDLSPLPKDSTSPEK